MNTNEITFDEIYLSIERLKFRRTKTETSNELTEFDQNKHFVLSSL